VGGLQGTAPVRRDRSRDGRLHVSRAQRSRILGAAVELLAEDGYWGLSVDRIVRRVQVSRRTFYDLFSDRDDCLAAAFDGALDDIAAVVVPAYLGEQRWRAQVRAALAALLEFLEREPQLGALAVMEPSRAGPWICRRRAHALELARTVVDRGRLEARTTHEPLPLTADWVVGGVLSILQTRISEGRGVASDELLNPLMANIVLPYMGASAARRELVAAVPTVPPGRQNGTDEKLDGATRAPLLQLPMRLTYRTLRTLSVLAETPGSSNRMVAEAAGISDQGQISKLLARLERLTLAENVAKGRPAGEANEWWLTALGEEIERTLRQHQGPPGSVPSRGSSTRVSS
jgi:AcrR family transcriptional regulator